MINLNNLTDIGLDGISYWDAPDFVDAYIIYAYDKVLGRELTDDELDELNDNYPDFIQEQVLEQVYG